MRSAAAAIAGIVAVSAAPVIVVVPVVAPAAIAGIVAVSAAPVIVVVPVVAPAAALVVAPASVVALLAAVIVAMISAIAGVSMVAMISAIAGVSTIPMISYFHGALGPLPNAGPRRCVIADVGARPVDPAHSSRHGAGAHAGPRAGIYARAQPYVISI